MTQTNYQSKPSINSISETLRQQLVLLRQSEKELETLSSELNKKRDNVDKMLQQHAQEWSNHREQYFNQLAVQLEANGIVLNDAEKAELRRGSITTSSIQEKLKTLEKLQIDLPSKASDFTIIVYDAIVAALSRTLQKIDSKAIKGIAKNLEVIDDENKASSKLKSNHAKQYETIVAAVKQLEDQIAKVAVLSPDQLHLLKQIEMDAKKPRPPKNDEEE